MNGWLDLNEIWFTLLFFREEAIQKSGQPTTSTYAIDKENSIYEKAETKEDYLRFLARLPLHIDISKSFNELSI